MSRDFEYALLVANESGEALAANHQDEPWESSSTIKVPLLTLALGHMLKVGDNLETRLARLPRHASRGAGILNWTDGVDFSLAELISTTLVFSDCLATNMLIDYIGGSAKLNSWLASQEFITRLKMDYLDFSDEEELLPKVGVTTCQEMLQLFRQLEKEDWPAEVQRLLSRSYGNLHKSWLEAALGFKPEQLHHKTGSMIQSSATGETVLNAVGSFMKNNKKYYFCLLSYGLAVTEQEVDRLKMLIAGEFGRVYENL